MLSAPTTAQSGDEAASVAIIVHDEKGAVVIEALRAYQSRPPATATMLTEEAPNAPFSVQIAGLNANVPARGAVKLVECWTGHTEEELVVLEQGD